MFGDLHLLLNQFVYFSPFWLALLFFAIMVFYYLYLKRLKGNHDHRARLVLFSVVGCVLLTFSLYNMLSFHLLNNMRLAESDNLYNPKDFNSDDRYPDIFYLIVDGYGREDILNELYDYDNRAFLSSLEQRGFYIAQKSKSNYCQTPLSLGTSLNLDYLDNLIFNLDQQSYDRRPLMELIKNSKVTEILEEKNYFLTSYFTPYSAVDINNMDEHRKRSLALNEFSHFMINKTMLSLALRDLQYELYRKDILNILDTDFESLAQDRPNYVYAHIIPPHPPFVFDSEGESLNPDRLFAFSDGSHWGKNMEDYIDGYTWHLDFINKSLLKMVDKIIDESEKPIIIIQADHGPGSELDWSAAENTNFEERLSILNAYYFYDHDYSQLYDEITPVNTFRIIFNQYFGTVFEVLKDESFFSTYREPYVFYDVE